MVLGQFQSIIIFVTRNISILELRDLSLYIFSRQRTDHNIIRNLSNIQSKLIRNLFVTYSYLFKAITRLPQIALVRSFKTKFDIWLRQSYCLNMILN